MFFQEKSNMLTSQIIHSWITAMLNKDIAVIRSLVSEDFLIEDGMNLEEYIEYEIDNFSRLSPLFDLGLDFKVQSICECTLTNDRITVFFYIINSKEKIVCKMHLTLDTAKGLVCSNNYISQVVPKYFIKNSEVSAYSLAIQSKIEPKYVYSSDFNDVEISKSSSFSDDGFYNVQMKPGDSFEYNNLFFFKIAYSSGKIEKKPVFFDVFKPELCPAKFRENSIELIDELYPVGIAVFYKDGTSFSKEYPRNFKIEKEKIDYIIVTDVLDNDWYFKI